MNPTNLSFDHFCTVSLEFCWVSSFISWYRITKFLTIYSWLRKFFISYLCISLDINYLLNANFYIISYTGIRSSSRAAAKRHGLSEEHGAGDRQSDGGGSNFRRPWLLSESWIHGILMYPRVNFLQLRLMNTMIRLWRFWQFLQLLGQILNFKNKKKSGTRSLRI